MAKSLHLYVHVPFCARKCPYCHFYNLGHDDGREALFLDGLAREITRWRARGVTRLSVGAQSFDDRRLRFLGRRHDGAQARTAVERAARCGFDDLSLDLMFSLAAPAEPAERRRAWVRDLATAFALPITHLSLYGLTLEPGTAFQARTRAGEALLASDKAFAAEYHVACREARRAGFEHYEVSSFALPGHRARHNAAYWSGVPYLGLGPAAHSFDGIRRWANVASLVAWAEAMSTGGDPWAFVEMLTPAQRDLETLLLGLRTREGVSAEHRILDEGRVRSLIRALVAEGLLARDRDRIACTERGYAVLDAILERLYRTIAAPHGRSTPAIAAPAAAEAVD